MRFCFFSLNRKQLKILKIESTVATAEKEQKSRGNNCEIKYFIAV